MARFRIQNWRGEELKQKVREAGGRALFMGGSHVLNEANNIAPLDEGPLTQTAFVDVDENEGKAHIVYVQKYGPRLHEDPRINIRRGRQMKWLEKTMIAQYDNVIQIIVNEMRRALGG